MRIKRMSAVLAGAGMLTAATVALGAGAADASTISTGYVQLCAQGGYVSFIEFPDRGGLQSTLVSPGQCWYEYLGTLDEEVPIEVFGSIDGTAVYLGEAWYNASVSGIGIGTEGAGIYDAPYFITW